jgi:ADP-ribose pyrophosphatase YjhB (NUDIX family)
VGCAVVASEGGRILLGRRGKEPMFGKWIIPGGGINIFERYSDTAIREFKEETGLDIAVRNVVHVAEIIKPSTEHRVVIYVAANVVGGEMRASSDLLDVRLFNRRELEEMAAANELTPTVRDVLLSLGWLHSDTNEMFSQARGRDFRGQHRSSLPNSLASKQGTQRRAKTNARGISVGGVQLLLQLDY